MGLNEFIQKNKEFWENNINENCNRNLLIEDVESPCILHDLAMHSIILNKAKGYKPIWFPKENVPIELLKSYIPIAEKAKIIKLNVFELAKAFFSAIVQFIKVLINRNILSAKYDGVKYGDIVYDIYLSRKQVGTIKRIDYLVFELILKCIKRHMLVIKTLKINNISAVLVSHRIGFLSGVLLRASMKYGCETYSLAGMHRATLFKSDKNEMIEYEYAPQKNDIDKFMSLPQEKFDKLYDFAEKFHIYGTSNLDAKTAFAEDNIFYDNKEEFAKDYNLDPNKKNIFVMLHSLTDHPHAHFKWMIFNDYADWFLKTLDFAKKDRNVNWIFKQHPSDKFYPTKDINFKKLFKNVPNNVVFLDNENNLDTRSLIHISDAIITCLGSAGFELPAMGGIPSITAGDNYYNGFGFSQNPKTKKQYFNILRDLKNIQRLSFEDQKRAKAVYMFISYFCTVDFTAMPILSFEEHHKSNMNDWYWDKVIEIYEQNRDVILNQMISYAKEVSKDDFKALRTSVSDVEKIGVISQCSKILDLK